MRRTVGESLLKRKGFSAFVNRNSHAHNVLMDLKDSPSSFKRSFMARIAEARKKLDYSQEEMAEVLGIKQDRYKNYETVNYMPHDMIPEFCRRAGVTIDWLFTGRKRLPRAKSPPSLRTMSHN